MSSEVESYFKSRPQLEARKYQIEVISETLEHLSENYSSILVESPTGSGKTIIGLAIADLLAKKLGHKKIGWVAMRRNLLTQAEKESFFVKTNCEIITFSMFDKNPPEVDILIVDEAHHDATASMAAIHKKLKPKKVIGLTATPMRTDRANLIFEKSVSRAGIYELIRTGYLAKPEQYIISDWSVESVVKCFLSDPKKWGQSIIYFFSIEECQRAEKLLRASNISVEVVHASSDREIQLEAFEKGECQVLINMAILTEGFDCPQLETAFVRPTNKSLTFQMSGRVLRIQDKIRKKIVQSQESKFPFQSLAPVACSYKSTENNEWKNLSFDQQFIDFLIQNTAESLKFLEERKGEYDDLILSALKDR